MNLVHISNWPIVKHLIEKQLPGDSFKESIIEFYCPVCLDMRRANTRRVFGFMPENRPKPAPEVRSRSGTRMPQQVVQGTPPAAPGGNLPALAANARFHANVGQGRLFPAQRFILELQCVQCHAEAILFVVEISGKQAISTLNYYGRQPGGTANSPEAVNHYLVEYGKSMSVGALSASAAMLRAALEQLLYDLGYKERMLGPKIAALVSEHNAGAGFRNAKTAALPTELFEYLDHVNSIGNGAIHANDGDISRQALIAAEDLNGLHTAIVLMLDAIYEKPVRDAAERQRYSALSAALTPAKKTP